MEKFGIFNLLSALSQLTGDFAANAQAPAETQSPAPIEQEAPLASGTGKPQTTGVFTPEQRKERAAQVLERHEQIARRLRKK